MLQGIAVLKVRLFTKMVVKMLSVKMLKRRMQYQFANPACPHGRKLKCTTSRTYRSEAGVKFASKVGHRKIPTVKNTTMVHQVCRWSAWTIHSPGTMSIPRVKKDTR